MQTALKKTKKRRPNLSITTQEKTIQFDKRSLNRQDNLSKAGQAVLELAEKGVDPEIIREFGKAFVESTKKPRKSPEKIKSELLTVRLTTNQLEKLQARADYLECTVSQAVCEWIRAMPDHRKDAK